MPHMNESRLQCVAGCCRVLQWVTARTSVLHVTYGKVQRRNTAYIRVMTLHCIVLTCVEVCWSVLKCVAAWCRVLRCVAACCFERCCIYMSQDVCAAVRCSAATCCSVLQRVAARCSALQRVAVFWSLLQRNIANTWIKIRGSFHTIAFPDSNQALFKSRRFRWGFRWFRSGSGWERQTRAVMAWVYVRVLARLQVIQGLN